MKSKLEEYARFYQENLRLEGWDGMFEVGGYCAYATKQLERIARLIKRRDERKYRSERTKIETIREDSSFCGNEQW